MSVAALSLPPCDDPTHTHTSLLNHHAAADERTTGQTARFLAALARDGKVEALDGGLWRLKA